VSSTPQAPLLPSQIQLESAAIPSGEDQNSVHHPGGVENYRAFENQYRQEAYPWEDKPNQPKVAFINWLAKRHNPDKIDLPPLTFAKRMLDNSVRRQDGLALHLWQDFCQAEAAIAENQALHERLQIKPIVSCSPLSKVPDLEDNSGLDPQNPTVILARLRAKWHLPLRQEQNRREVCRELEQHPEWEFEIGPDGPQEVPF
jgi:hypothetical protein